MKQTSVKNHGSSLIITLALTLILLVSACQQAEHKSKSQTKTPTTTSMVKSNEVKTSSTSNKPIKTQKYEKSATLNKDAKVGTKKKLASLTLAEADRQAREREMMNKYSDAVSAAKTNVVSTPQSELKKEAKTAKPTIVIGNEAETTEKQKASQTQVSPSSIESNSDEEEIRVEDVRASTEKAIETTRRFIQQKEQQYIRQIEKRYYAFEKEVEKLIVQAQKLKQESKNSISSQAKVLQKDMQNAESQLTSLSDAGGKTIEELGRQLDAMLNKVTSAQEISSNLQLHENAQEANAKP